MRRYQAGQSVWRVEKQLDIVLFIKVITQEKNYPEKHRGSRTIIQPPSDPTIQYGAGDEQTDENEKVPGSIPFD